MKNSVARNSSFMEHEFWNYLNIKTNSFLFERLPSFTADKRQQLLALIIEGFYPISYCSPTVFLRFAALCDDPESAAISRKIGEVELGKWPLMPESTFRNMWHCKQLKMMLESLEVGFTSELPEPFEMDLWKKADLENADIIKAGSVCEIIENTAPDVICNYQDFVTSWQFVFKINSRNVQRNYLDEHGLTEGNAHEGQHISLINKMLRPLGDSMESVEYRAHGAAFNALCIAHLSNVNSRIKELLDPEV